MGIRTQHFQHVPDNSFFQKTAKEDRQFESRPLHQRISANRRSGLTIFMMATSCLK
jgi:hypothetical protein